MTPARLQLAAAMLATVAPTLPPAAQAQTVIVADTAPDRTTGTIVTRNGTTTTIDGGWLAGTNLFHSLSTFSLGTGETATWQFSFGNPASIRNVISRVTGGEASVIDGTINSTALRNANFFFINPAGIVLAGNAQINVPAGAHFAAASYLDFAQGGRFSAVTPGGSTFSMAQPASFGFLGTEGAMAVLGSQASRPWAIPGALTLAGRDLTIANRKITTGSMFSAGQGLRLIAAGSKAIDLPIVQRGIGSTLATGQLSLTNAELLSASGEIAADAGNIDIASSAIATGDRTGSKNLIFKASNRIAIQGSRLNTAATGDQDAGFIFLQAPDIQLSANTALISDQSGIGNQGFIAIEGDTVRITDSLVSARATGDGDAGLIAITARTITVDGTSAIETTSIANGIAGSIQLQASESIRLLDRAVLASNNANASNVFNFAGFIQLQAPDISLTGNARITSNSTGSGNPGNITVAADSFRMDGGGIELTTSGTGPAGMLDIAAATIRLANGAVISSDTSARGDAGSITIRAGGDLAIGRGVKITSSTSAAGDAGSITVAAGAITLDRSAIETVVAQGASGAAGSIFINAAGAIVLRNGSQIASTNGGLATSAASPGTITVTARSVELANGSQITTNSALGPAGSIRLALPSDGILRLRGGSLGSSTITTSSGPGTGGVITIDRPIAIVSQGGNIFALGEQAGANVVIRAQFYIDAADTLDLIRVNGTFTFDGQLDYIAAGEEPRDIGLLDAGAVLAGRCRAAQARGGSSQLSIAAIGPYGVYDPVTGRGEDRSLPLTHLDHTIMGRACG